MSKKGRPNKYDFAGMKVGWYIECELTDPVWPAWAWYKKYHGLDWKMKQTKDGNKLIFERIK